MGAPEVPPFQRLSPMPCWLRTNTTRQSLPLLRVEARFRSIPSRMTTTTMIGAGRTVAEHMYPITPSDHDGSVASTRTCGSRARGLIRELKTHVLHEIERMIDVVFETLG